MPHNDYTGEELVRLAREIYEREVRGEVEPAGVGRFLALDVESGDYEVADGALESSERLIERRPGATVYLMRVGYEAAYGIGARPRRRM